MLALTLREGLTARERDEEETGEGSAETMEVGRSAEFDGEEKAVGPGGPREFEQDGAGEELIIWDLKINKSLNQTVLSIPLSSRRLRQNYELMGVFSVIDQPMIPSR